MSGSTVSTPPPPSTCALISVGIFFMAYIPSKTLDVSDVSFSKEELMDGEKKWGFSLVGHAIGNISFYCLLLTTIRHKWNFKGWLELLTLKGDFFLFKLTYKEDYDLVYDNGSCFLNDRSFLFQK